MKSPLLRGNIVQVRNFHTFGYTPGPITTKLGMMKVPLTLRGTKSRADADKPARHI